MPTVVFAPVAIRDLERLRAFLRTKNPDAARRAGEAIRKGVLILGSQPRLGRPIHDFPDDFREWPIDFGDSGFIARYRFDETRVVILTIRHQKEA
ncbi:MAG: hypothetical protein RIR62_592 [Pseudomonadota bacterium]|jgi:plasmid stabilization system protein ParE